MQSLLLLLLPIITHQMLTVITLYTQLTLPAPAYSLLTISRSAFSRNLEYDITATLDLRQRSEGAVLFDSFVLDSMDSHAVSCYISNVKYLNSAYSRFESCSFAKDCQFPAKPYLRRKVLRVKLIEEGSINAPERTVVIDNTLYPCQKGVYSGEVSLDQTIEITIESNGDYFLLLKIVCLALLQMLASTLAWVMLLWSRLQSLKKQQAEEERKKMAKRAIETILGEKSATENQ